ncbi:MAG: Hpt domain-containing protein [Bacteroidota bacterium]
MEEHGQKKDFSYHPELDVEIIHDLYEDDYDYAFQMFDIFLRNIPSEIEKLQQAFAASDWQVVKDVAHKMKPTFTMVGLPTLREQLESIERSLLENNNQQVGPFLAEFEKQFDYFLPIIKSQYQALKDLLEP